MNIYNIIAKNEEHSIPGIGHDIEFVEFTRKGRTGKKKVMKSL